jgi:sulfate transport system ATP-binding protein
MSSIVVEGITKRYGAAIAVEEVRFEVASGELCALLGPSGSGKSTVLRIIAGLETPSSGRVIIAGRPMDGVPPERRGVGLVFQGYALFRHLHVADNVAFGLRVRHWEPEAVSARVGELLEFFGLASLAERRPHELSGGQRQRVAIARALAPRPEVLLLDEPFAALDARIRAELRAWLRGLHDQLHVTSLFVTHDQEEAAALADRVVVMSCGRVEQIGPPRHIYDRPASDFVADFIGPMNTFGARVEHGRAVSGAFRMEVQPGLPEGSAVTVRIRPHDIELSRGLHGLPALVRRVQFLGALVRVEVEVLRGGPPLAVLVPSRLADRVKTAPGQKVRLRIRAGRVSLGGPEGAGPRVSLAGPNGGWPSLPRLSMATRRGEPSPAGG